MTAADRLSAALSAANAGYRIERFVVEIKTTAALQHPRILPFFDSGTADRDQLVCGAARQVASEAVSAPVGGFSPRLTYFHTSRMVIHMKTTLNIDDSVMVRLKREAARTGRTMSELVETALRNLLQTRRDRETLPPLPSFDGGGALVDIADRDALYHAMEGR